MCECCGRVHAVMKLVFAVLLLVNIFLWPQWLGIDGWIAFVAVLMVLWSVVKLIWPSCCSCNCEVEKKPAKASVKIS
ncbi:hypothetical protein HZC32_02995 [Candidatus Woesearchaeota archaeon]|nr:hypothetical protein [Candidatus Woesearchaeota archaeon]